MHHTPSSLPEIPAGPVAPVDAARIVARLARSRAGSPDPSAEVHQLGTLLARLLGPTPPPQPLDPTGLEAPPAPNLLALPPPLALQLAVETATSAPGDRYRSPAQLAATLEAWLAAEDSRPRPRERRPVPALHAIAAAAAALCLVPLAVGAAGLAATWTATSTAAAFSLPAAAHSAPIHAGPVTAAGVPLDRAHAQRAVAWVNAADPEVLAAAGVHRRAVQALVVHRPLQDIDAVASVPGVGASAVRAIAAATEAP
jgi:hypothetical protein